MNQIDLAIASRVLYGEARGENTAGRNAVAHVLLNRVSDGRWGKSLLSVCHWPGQFSCMNTKDRNYSLVTASDENDPWLQRMLEEFKGAMLDSSDPTCGATHYYSPLGGFPPPDWVEGASPCGQFGHQLFFKKVR